MSEPNSETESFLSSPSLNQSAPSLLLRDAKPWRLPFIRGLRAVLAEAAPHLPVKLLIANIVLQCLVALFSLFAVTASAGTIGAIVDGDFSSALGGVAGSTAALLGCSLSTTAAAASGESLRISLRAALTLRGLRSYLRGAAPFTTGELGAAARLGRVLDTPDQRLTGDIDNLSRALGALLWGGYEGGSGIVATVVSVIASALTIKIAGAGSLPIIVALLFSALATVVTTVIANGSNVWSFRADEAMGHARAAYAHVAFHAREIDAWGGQSYERFILAREVRALCVASGMATSWTGATAAWSGLQATLPTILGYMVAVAVISRGADGKRDATIVGVVAGTTASLTRALSLFPILWSALANMGGSLARVTQLWAATEWKEKGSELGSPDAPAGGAAAAVRFDASLGRAMVGAWQVRMAAGRLGTQVLKSRGSQVPPPNWAIFLAGPSGVGKSTTLRLLAGLLPGDEARPSSDIEGVDDISWRPPAALYLPQRPYVPPCSLFQAVSHSPWSGHTQGDDVEDMAWLVMNTAEAAGASVELKASLSLAARSFNFLSPSWFCAPKTAASLRELSGLETGSNRDFREFLPQASLTDAAVCATLDSLGLGALVARFGLHSPRDWQTEVSGGELARIAVAALVTRPPRVALLDEPFSALDQDSERLCRVALMKSKCCLVVTCHGAPPVELAAFSETIDLAPVSMPESAAERVASDSVRSTDAAPQPLDERDRWRSIDVSGQLPAARSRAQPNFIEAAAVTATSALWDAWTLWRTMGLPRLREIFLGFRAQHAALLSPLGTLTALIAVSLGAIGSTLISLSVPRVVGDAFEAILSGNASSVTSKLSAAALLFIASPLLSAAVRTGGGLLSIQWFAVMSGAGADVWLSPSHPARLVLSDDKMPISVNDGVWLKWQAPRESSLAVFAAALGSHGSHAGLDRLDQRLVADAWALSQGAGPFLWGGGDTLPLVQVLATAISSCVAISSYGPLPALIAIGYAILGVATARVLAAHVPSSAATVDAAEGFLRAPLLRVAARSEDAALSGEVAAERVRAVGGLVGLMAASLTLVRTQAPARAAAELLALLGGAGAAAVVATMAAVGTIPNNASAIFELSGLLSVLALYAGSAATIVVRAAAAAGPASRVASALRALRAAAGEVAVKRGEAGPWRDPPFDKVALSLPQALRTRGGEATSTIEQGGVAHILGASGSGKSSLLRSLLGSAPTFCGELWVRVASNSAWAQGGAMLAHGPRGLLLTAPQRPYWPLGASALEAVAYPQSLDEVGRARARTALRLAGLTHLEIPEDLANAQASSMVSAPLSALSGGERQRLMLARIIFAAPHIAILDEPLAALGGEGWHAMQAIQEAGAAIFLLNTR